MAPSSKARAVMSSQITFYTHPQSRGRLTRWMLEETGLPYDTRLIEYGAKMKSPEYLAINPMGKVPALKHGDAVVITENAAIVMYLADLVPERKLAPPIGSHERGSYYRWISFIAPVEYLMTAKANGGTLGDPTQAGYGREEDVITTLEAAVGGHEYLAGNHFTAADLFVAASLGFYMQFNLLEARPAFRQFVERHNARAAAKKANALDDALMEQIAKA